MAARMVLAALLASARLLDCDIHGPWRGNSGTMRRISS
jgi:hypothetical protein